MGGGTGVVTTPGVLPRNLTSSAPRPPPDLTDEAVLAARRAQMRTLGAKQGLASTFLTTPQPGATTSLLGGAYGGASTGSS